MLNVLSLVSYQFLPPSMGGQKCIALGNKYLSKYLNLTCVTTENNIATGDVNYSVLNVLSNSKLRYINIFYFFKIKKLIKKNRISHLIIEHPYYGWLAILLKHFYGIKLIVRSHNIEAIRFKTIGKWWWILLWNYEKMVHQSADLSFFITEDDKDYAIKHFLLNPTKCLVVTYGFELEQIPSIESRQSAKKRIKKKYSIGDDDIIILFNGTLDYLPNLKAIDVILSEINPALLQTSSFNYKIIICGKSLPQSYNNLTAYSSNNVVFAGFVDDITSYYLASDIFINPVIDGGGIKTKIVEALGYNVSLVTTQSGAIGISNEITGDKMKIVGDNNWDNFTESILKINISKNIPATYFQYFYWDKIAKKASDAIKQI